MISMNKPTFNYETITPEQAKMWLETYNILNRDIRESHAEDISRDMKNGEWMLTHIGIAFDTTGAIVDGQHRLQGVVKAGIPVEMVVCRGLDSRVREVLDCGKNRSAADILTLSQKYGKVTKDQIDTLKVLLGGFSKCKSLSQKELAADFEKHYNAIKFASENLPKASTAKGINTPVTLGVIARAYYCVNTDKLKEFCSKLTTGIVSADEGYIVKLRQMLQSPPKGEKLPRKERYTKIERVLTAWLSSETIKGIHPVKEEQFPLPEKSFCCA